MGKVDEVSSKSGSVVNILVWDDVRWLASARFPCSDWRKLATAAAASVGGAWVL